MNRNKKHFFSLIFLIFTSISLLNSQQPDLNFDATKNLSQPEIKDKYEWLVFVFINGVNDLGMMKLSLNDINEMETIGSTDRVAVVVEHNRISQNSDGTPSFSNGANTYFIVKDKPNNPEIVSKIINQTPDADMGSYIHFAISAQYAIKRFNPEKVLIIIWNHGNGFFGISYDDISRNNINMPQLAQALKDITKAYGKKIDIFAMDACLMQMAEVVAELKDYANYIVASEETIPGAGYPYDDILSMLNNISSPKKAAIEIVELYHRAYSYSKPGPFGNYRTKAVTLSAIDTSKFETFITLLNKWVKKAMQSQDFKNITDKSVTENVFFFQGGDTNETENYYSNGIITSESENVITRTADLIDYLKKAKEKMTDEDLKSETEKLINFISKDLILIHRGGNEINGQGFSYKDNTYGMAIYLPLLRYNSSKYETLKFPKISLWDEFLKNILIRENINKRADLALETNKENNTDEKEIDFDGNGKFFKSEEIETASINTKINTENGNKTLLAQAYGSAYHSNIKNNTSNINISNSQTPVKNFSNTTYSLPTEQSKVIYNKVSSNQKETETTNKTSFTVSQPISENSDSSTLNTSIDAIKNTISETKAKLNELFETIFPDKEKIKNYQEKLKEFEIEISTNLNILYARKLIEDSELQKEFTKIDKNKTLKLISYSNAIIELEKIVSKNYSQEDLNSLSKTLETTLDKSRLICELNICIPPEKVSQWMEKWNYPSYNISNIEIAIRKWEKIFSDDDPKYIGWSQAGSVKFDKTTWTNMSVKERNAVLEKIIRKAMKYDLSNPIISMSDKRSTQVQKYNELSEAVENVSQKMLETKIIDQKFLDALKDKPLSEQIYILSNLFDRGNFKSNPDMEVYINRINANRTSFTTETLNDKSSVILSKNMFPSILSEINKTKTGKNLTSQIDAKNLKFSIEYLDGVDSKTDGNRIVVDAKIIEQFLRIKGATTANLIKDEKLKSELSLYLSPLIIREMANIVTENKLKHGYNPGVREKYAIGLLYQAKYTQEKMSDTNFKNLFNSFSGLTDYADKTLIVKRNYEKSDNEEDFIQSAGIKYYSNLPSASSAKSEILLAINKELERRNSLDKKERENIDKYALFSSRDIYKLSPYEITNYIKNIKTDALLQLQKELLSQKNFYTRLTEIIKET